jgi:glycosyltransferase involved in cell wall biosynthesis
MRIKNNTNNTLYIEDLDLHLPYKDGAGQVIDPDTLKKSKTLRGFIINGLLDVVEYDPGERIEASIMYLREKASAVVQQNATEEYEEAEVTDLSISPDDIEVRIHGIFLDGGGYAKVNRNLALKLDEAGLKVKVDAKRSQNQLRESELVDIQRLARTKLSKQHISIDSVIPSFAEYATGKYRILYTTVESYTVPKQFLECCQMYDEIWITSPWSMEILKKQVDKPIYHIPAGVDHELYCEHGPRFDFRPNIKDFVFISVFGWSYRKGYDVLLKAYFEEFDASDNVSLLIASKYQSGTTRSHRNRIRDDINKIMKEFPNKDMPHVVRHSQMIPEEQMPQLYRSADCFVLPSRGEGSNLCGPEASLCGLPVIMTNVSGQQMYLRPDNAFLIEMDALTEMRTGQMHLHYWDGQKFPALVSPEVRKHLREAMRYVIEHPDEARMRNRKLQRLIKEQFTWNNTANAAIARLRQINKEIKS